MLIAIIILALVVGGAVAYLKNQSNNSSNSGTATGAGTSKDNNTPTNQN